MTDLGRACVVVASTRAATGVYPDKSGPILSESLSGLGFQVSEVVVVPDGDAVGEALRAAIGEHDVVLTSGGTGITPTDVTPQQTAPLLDYEVPQIPAAIARFGVDKGIPTALLSRGLAGVAGRTLVINLPGSSGGVRDAMEVLAPILPHAVSQLRGGDH
ncbi:MogA/MoaB family molybdenum cofactor biosynthesis protein [Enemella evansiae]|uniref:MogA/MoaB family molybdenum cofactor biosynthesis protein n=1 Tax=Enemella evansiae TaxID=2016499 RepID=UPI000B970AE6|nr:MogA/MoaB family molybdenum cofactor biosynthesis protein [Enemella evansiae]OYN94980.1 molybdenum cofactor biosynthesis protein [Enemella evansiae]OYO04824.1 molybdenum cofactor biosynthesis protein [Enemella evansiae]OYO06475.1 molybdenum cofactor biosynthesis protein [Enemella evansiae]